VVAYPALLFRGIVAKNFLAENEYFTWKEVIPFSLLPSS
jgi:hypothetical protein